MVGRRSQRKKVASPPQEDPDPMLESSITTPQARHPEPEPQPDPQPEMHTEPEPAEPVVPPEHPPDMPSTSPDQAQFARMRIDDGMESGESSYRTTMPAPEAITFQSPDVLEHGQEDDDNDSMMIEPCRNFGSYSSWIKKNFLHLVPKKHLDFMNDELELYDQDRLFELYYYQPIQWVDFLGKTSYLKHYKFIIELNLIWTATIHMRNPIDYETYHQIREDSFDQVFAAFKREADNLMKSNLSGTLPEVYPMASTSAKHPLASSAAETSMVVHVKTPNVVQVKTSKI